MNLWFTGDQLKKILETTGAADKMDIDLAIDFYNNYGQFFAEFVDLSRCSFQVEDLARPWVTEDDVFDYCVSGYQFAVLMDHPNAQINSI